MEQNNKEAIETAKPTTEHFAMEILKQEHERSRAKNVGIIGMAVGMVALAIVAAVITIHLTNVNYQNDRDWRELFSSYDYITQDGDGINSANYGEQGDLNNGATSKDIEE